jgi:CPA1 family monovalent cation:H+ antiporter
MAVFAGGLAVGLALGFALGELLRAVRTGASSSLAMSLVMAYLSFVVAEHYLHVSGVMAAAGSALAFGMWGVTRLPPEDASSLREVWELVALVCNSLLFLLVGLSVDPAGLVRSGPAVLVAVALVLVVRAGLVYGLLPAATRWFSLPRVSVAERHVLWWGGLKGGLAIAMALAIPTGIAGRDLVLDLTVGVVVFTLLVNAPTIRPLMRALGLERMDADERTEFTEGLREAHAAGPGFAVPGRSPPCRRAARNATSTGFSRTGPRLCAPGTWRGT